MRVMPHVHTGASIAHTSKVRASATLLLPISKGYKFPVWSDLKFHNGKICDNRVIIRNNAIKITRATTLRFLNSIFPEMVI
jgi:hypothetical protein